MHQDIIISKLLPFLTNQNSYAHWSVTIGQILAASGYYNKNFKNVKGCVDYRTIISSFAVFKEINERWNHKLVIPKMVTI
jgi:hypothetical protein